MDEETVKKAFDELLPSLEALETQCTAVLRLLQEKKTSQKRLASYLEEAGNASSVKWLAHRVRIEHILSAAHGADEKLAEPVISGTPKQEPAENNAKEAEQKQQQQAQKAAREQGESSESTEKTEPEKTSEASSGAAEKSAAEVHAEKSQDKSGSRENKSGDPGKHEETEAA